MAGVFSDRPTNPSGSEMAIVSSAVSEIAAATRDVDNGAAPKVGIPCRIQQNFIRWSRWKNIS
jgi:hypothetical protein